VCLGYSQTTDSLTRFKNIDTVSVSEETLQDTHLVQQCLQWIDNNNFLLAKRSTSSDIQQVHSFSSNASIFMLLTLLLLIVTYVKVVFGNEVEELLQFFSNANIAQQIFRMRPTEITFSSFLLQVNFIVALSLYVQFILGHYFHFTSSGDFFSTLSLIFLFTFFYLTKIITVRWIGLVFEMKQECSEYIFNFSTVCKMLGLTLIPALFIFYTRQQNFFDLIFVISILITIALAIIFVWRGLSTGNKVLYRSIYHFFIYVCVVEISTIFLLFKLLTKTIT
jgi:hypothetical protein